MIDVNAFHLWLEQVQHIDFLSEADEKDRAGAYGELKSGKALDLKKVLEEW